MMPHLDNVYFRAYLAGVWESRGTLELLPKIGSFRIGIRMDHFLPEWLHKQFGGTCFKHGKKYWFRIQGKNAYPFLEAIRPYLVFRREEITRILESRKRRGSSLL